MCLSSILLITANGDECSSLGQTFTNEGVPVHCITGLLDSDVLQSLDEMMLNGHERPSLTIIDLDDSRRYRTGLLSMIKQHSYCLTTPVIAFSRNTDNSFVERIYQQGAISVFRRPQDWTYFAKTLLTYWTQSDIHLPTVSANGYQTQWQGVRRSTGLSYSPWLQAE